MNEESVGPEDVEHRRALARRFLIAQARAENAAACYYSRRIRSEPPRPEPWWRRLLSRVTPPT